MTVVKNFETVNIIAHLRDGEEEERETDRHADR